MKKVYILEAFRKSPKGEIHGIEFRVFTSKATATKSYDAMVEYIMKTYYDDVVCYVDYKLEKLPYVVHEAVIESKFRVIVQVHEVIKRVVSYL